MFAPQSNQVIDMDEHVTIGWSIIEHVINLNDHMDLLSILAYIGEHY